nr:MAG TPA: hypothetical protein [Myoviridae sp. ctNPX13]
MHYVLDLQVDWCTKLPLVSIWENRSICLSRWYSDDKVGAVLRIFSLYVEEHVSRS